jgi:arginyl-tRNA synthetase
MNILVELRNRFAAALTALVDDEGAVSELCGLVLPSQDAKFGDYQANMAMPLGKRLGKPPRKVAAELVARLDLADLCEPPTIAGPGFINLRLRDAWLAGVLRHASPDVDRIGVDRTESPRRFVLDYSAPNVAKPMHVGHIRSTVIGDALYRVLKFQGHEVTSDNHIGDWGTQFGMIIYGWKQFGDEAALARSPVEELTRLYKLANQMAIDDPRVNAAVLAETAALHAGDATNRALWDRFLPACLTEIDGVYQRLGVSFDHALGESFYEEALPDVVADLQAKGLATESEGAVCVFNEGHKAPFLVQKKDGAFLYATTDLATIKYRVEHWRPDAILYVVDHRQSDHFKQLFATARRWGYDQIELEHVSFGTVLGDDGKPFKTRSGTSVGLMGLLDEAVERAHRIVCENDDARPEPLLSAEDRLAVAERVGIGAIKYADLAHNRTSDYKFSYDKMLAMTGNTAAYMQYSYARVRSIFDKGGVDPGRLRLSGSEITLDHPAERALALSILQFSEALDRVTADYRPNYLTDYLFDVASKYASFFENCPVLKAESDELRTSRLLLCDLTARTIERGLNLLGISVVGRM